VHFPIALLIVAFLFEVLALIFKNNYAFLRASFFLFIIGTIGAIVAVVTGSLFTEELNGPGHDTMENHHMFAFFTMYLAILVSLLKVYLVVKKKERTSLKWLSFTGVLVTMVTVGLAGYYGGALVYDFMIKM
jgi:uncharacterized membrane protein